MYVPDFQDGWDHLVTFKGSQPAQAARPLFSPAVDESLPPPPPLPPATEPKVAPIFHRIRDRRRLWWIVRLGRG